MRSYTIIKVLALSFGVVSVVARSLPEQRSEIHARAPGGYGFSNPITKLDNADAKVDAAVSKDIDDLMRRNTGLEKRDVNIEGARCLSTCTTSQSTPSPPPGDCAELYRALYNTAVQFSVAPFDKISQSWGSCTAWFINNTADTVVYDYWDFGGTTQYLNGKCIMGMGMPFGGCKFGEANVDFEHSAYIAVAHPSYFG